MPNCLAITPPRAITREALNPLLWAETIWEASSSGRTKEHKLKLVGPDIFRWGGGLPRERAGAKKFGMLSKPRKKQLLGAGYLGIWLGSGVPEKFGKIKLVATIRVIPSQKLSRDNGETIFALRHLDVSHGPLRSDWSGRRNFGHGDSFAQSLAWLYPCLAGYCTVRCEALLDQKQLSSASQSIRELDEVRALHASSSQLKRIPYLDSRRLYCRTPEK